MNPVSNQSTILMAAILSMDVYNNDPVYASKILRSRLGKKLGSWTLDSGPNAYNSGTAFGAGAATLDSGGETIVAYEGAISPSTSIVGAILSAWNGYSVFFGAPRLSLSTFRKAFASARRSLTLRRACS